MDTGELRGAIRRWALRQRAGGARRAALEEPLRAQLLSRILLALAAALVVQGAVFLLAGVGRFTFGWAVVEPMALVLAAAWLTRRRRILLATTLLVVASSHAAAFTIAHFGLHHWTGSLLALTILLCGLMIGAYFVATWTLICCALLVWLQVARLHDDWSAALGWCALYVATGWLVMLFSRHLERLLAVERAAEEQQRGAIVAERTRFARELHDTLAQGFTGVVIQLNAVEARLAADPAGARRHLATARDLARQNLDEARRSARALRPGMLTHGTLPAAMELVGRQLTAGSDVDLVVRSEGEVPALPTLPTLPEDVEAELLRIGQEALTNAVRHAGARRIEVCLRYGADATELSVADDGCGLRAAGKGGGTGEAGGLGGTGEAGRTGSGLRNMAERARQVGGELALEPGLGGRGTTVRAVVPRGARPTVEPGR